MDYTDASLLGKLLYLSGPITDPDIGQYRRNMDTFFDTAYGLRQEGWVVFNPAELETEGWTWEMYIARDIQWIVENRPKLYMLAGWRTSRGARLEHALGLVLGLEIMEEK